jgi:hypothetical protein
MSEISDSEKSQILSDILDSAEFKDSKRHQDLLKYLVEKSETEGAIKEFEIAVDVFDKDSSFDPNINPLIRSYISNLRKKLEHYYLTTKNQYSYRLEIPKGQYVIKYIHVDKSKKIKGQKKYLNYIYIAIILVLVSLLIYNTLKSPDNSNGLMATAAAPNPIWKEFLQKNNRSTVIVLGDYFFMAEKNSGDERIFMRNTKINSDKDFQKFLKEYPTVYNKFEALKFTYLRPSACFGLLNVLRVLGTSSQNVTIKLASQLKWEDFDKHNIVFIGTFKTLNKLDTLVTKTNIRISVEPSSLKIINAKKDTTQSFSVSWLASNYQKDYSVLLKIPGSMKNTILLCLGFSEIGVMQAVNLAVDPNFIQQVQNFSKENITHQPLFFEMVSETEGIELTTFRSQIRYFHLLPPNKSDYLTDSQP